MAVGPGWHVPLAQPRKDIMDSIRFDHLSRLLATCTTRRACLGLLTALALLGLAQTPTRALPCTKPWPLQQTGWAVQ